MEQIHGKSRHIPLCENIVFSIDFAKEYDSGFSQCKQFVISLLAALHVLDLVDRQLARDVFICLLISFIAYKGQRQRLRQDTAEFAAVLHGIVRIQRI